MHNPSAHIHALPRGNYSPRFIAGAMFVAAIHVIALWALINGFAPKIVKLVTPGDIETRIIPVEHPKPVPQPPKPPVAMHHPRHPPRFRQRYPRRHHRIPIRSRQCRPLPTRLPTSRRPASSTPTPPRPIRRWRAGSDRRHGAAAHFHLCHRRGYRCGDRAIERHSGTDRTAADWVKAHWRYNPAVQAGVAVASTTMALVNFNLRNAR